MLDLAAINWRRDQRNKTPDVYVVPPNDAKNRINRFMSGWQAYLDDPERVAKSITWGNLGCLFASVLGDIPAHKRRAVYAILLHQYVHSSRAGSWTAEDREKAMGHLAKQS